MSTPEALEREQVQRELNQILKRRGELLKEKLRIETELERLRQGKDPNSASGRRQRG